MRFRLVLLGVMGVLGCAAESQAGPIDLRGFHASSHAESRHSWSSMRDQFTAFGHLGSPARSQHWYQVVLLSMEITPDSLIRDDRFRVAGADMSELVLPERMGPFRVVPANWWLGNARPAIGSLSRGHYAQPKERKDQCKGGPCPTPVPEPTRVPEPTTAMLLAIGSGLVAVSTRRRRQ